MGMLMADIYITASKAAVTAALVVCIIKAVQHAVFYGVSYAERREMKVKGNKKQHIIVCECHSCKYVQME